MASRKRKLHNALCAALLSAFLAVASAPVAALAAESEAAGTNLPSIYAGAGVLLDPRAGISELLEVTDNAGNPANTSGQIAAADASANEAASAAEASTQSAEAEERSPLVMADVNEIMNVRAAPSASSEKIGVLYKDCGGTILEQTAGWTKLQSGDLVGWASDDYLLFGKEAETLARDVGVLTAVITTDSLRVRKAPDKESGIYGLVKTGDKFEVIEEDDGSGFIHIDYKGKDGYISADYARIDLRIDHGETLEAIKAREEAERALKAKLTANQGAVQTSEDEVRLLAALIQCEAANQPYEGQLGVGAVVMNRVRSGAYPNTVVSVIYASGQFSPAGNGRVADAYNGSIKDSCMQAARAAINGETTVGSALHFRRVGMHEGTVIGGHVFW